MNKRKGHQFTDKKMATGFLVVIAIIILGSSWIFFNSLKDEPQSPVILEVADGESEYKNGVHIRTGLKRGEGLTTVIAHCTACHSAEVIIQNRMNEERWNATIKWMQETQNLWDLGENQKVIVNYLVKNYPVINKGRRAKLDDIEWYELED